MLKNLVPRLHSYLALFYFFAESKLRNWSVQLCMLYMYFELATLSPPPPLFFRGRSSFFCMRRRGSSFLRRRRGFDIPSFSAARSQTPIPGNKVSLLPSSISFLGGKREGRSHICIGPFFHNPPLPSLPCAIDTLPGQRNSPKTVPKIAWNSSKTRSIVESWPFVFGFSQPHRREGGGGSQKEEGGK